MLGVLYHRPGPDQPPFVAVGDAITPDTTVAIIEVMKLMNPVYAGVHGVIAEVCAQDATTVEYGDVLFRLEG
jgi:acetyl-CoA carboxylase biotin carboxyl carrier protein